MPHRCVKCNKVFGDDSSVLECCCGSKAFMFVRNGDHIHIIAEEDGKYNVNITGMLEEDAPEEIRHKDGKYDIDVEALLKKE